MNLHFLNLSSYTAPSIVESPRMDWIEYGEQNDYFKYLIDRYNGSATNNAILNGVVELLYGRGLDAVDAARKPDQYAQMKALLSKKTNRRALSDLKMLGQCALQVIYSVDRSRITEVHHLPIETIRVAKANEDGDVEGYYYAKDWAKVNGKRKPTFFPAFGSSNEPSEILYVKPYRSGYYYYAPVDYQGGLPYAELEEEVANYHINNVKNSLSPSMLINFNNGVPSDEEQMAMERKINQKFSGSGNSGKMILAFNDNVDSQASIEPVQLSDAHSQYQFLADESMRKLMVAHRVTSPMLLGIKDNSGLGNNADEIKTASLLFQNTVIRPIQELYIDALDGLLAYNDISLKLYFKSLQPLAFKEAEMPKEELSSDESPNYDLLDEFGESIDEAEWELVEEVPVDYDAEQRIIDKYDFASTGTAFPNAKSKQDGVTDDLFAYKVRYKYAGGNGGGERDFCSKMIAAAKVYRMEDIQAMRGKPVNAGFGKGGSATYDIWLYKGGARCRHFWMRQVYMATKELTPVDTKNPNAEIGVNSAKRKGADIKPNAKDVARPPFDMDYAGFTPEYAKKHGIPK